MDKHTVGQYMVLHAQVGAAAERLLAQFKAGATLLSQHPAHFVHFSHVDVERMVLVYTGCRYPKNRNTPVNVTMALPVRALTEPAILDKIIQQTSEPMATIAPDSSTSFTVKAAEDYATSTATPNTLVLLPSKPKVVSTLPPRSKAQPLGVLLNKQPQKEDPCQRPVVTLSTGDESKNL